MMQKHGVLSNNLLDGIAEYNVILTLGDREILVIEVVLVSFRRQNDGVFAQLYRLFPGIPIIIGIVSIAAIIVESVFRVRPFAILLLEFVCSHFLADIANDAGDILILLTQQAVPA